MKILNKYSSNMTYSSAE